MDREESLNAEKLKRGLAKLYSIEKSLTGQTLGERHKNLSDQVYEIIKKMIIYHELKPGDRIIDKHLADDLGVSRSLVRQALNILKAEELVTSVPRSGYYVKEIRKKDVIEIFDIRKVLERYALEVSIPVLNQDDFDILHKAFDEANEDLNNNQVTKLLEADVKLHAMFINSCGNDRVRKIINKYNNYYDFYRIVDLVLVERAMDSYYEHLEILKAAEKRNVKIAVELMDKHIEDAKTIILNNFERYTFI